MSVQVDLFIPEIFFEFGPCTVFCLCEQLNNKILANCVCLTRTDDKVTDVAVELGRLTIGFNYYIGCGTIGKSAYATNDRLNFRIDSDQYGEFKVLEVRVDNEPIQNVITITYNSREISNAELLGNKTDPTFLDFINGSTRAANKARQNLNNITRVSYPPWPKSNLIRNTFIFLVSCLLYPLHKIHGQFSIPDRLAKSLKSTATGRQIANKFNSANNVYKLLQNKEISLICGNQLFALIFDLITGIIIMYFLRNYFDTGEFFESAIEKTDSLVNDLQKLLYWLMGVPAGLKLNRPLNTVCGRFFSYHIYLWKTYIVVIKPHLLTALNFSINFGIFGTTFLLSLANDFISLATIHIYFFYIYATRLYELKISGCICLWRLFRGKKWNPLRNRVDSYHYDVQQLFIGTLIFTIIVILLPTVAVYYFVFTLLRVLMLIFFWFISKLNWILSTLPIYVIVLQLLGHNYIKGDLYFQTPTASDHSLSMSMKAIPISWGELLRRTSNQDIKSDQPASTWAQLGFSLIRGKIIYPL